MSIIAETWVYFIAALFYSGIFLGIPVVNSSGVKIIDYLLFVLFLHFLMGLILYR